MGHVTKLWTQTSPQERLLPIIGSKGSKFNKKVKEAQEVARINYFGTSQLKYKLKVEAVSLYFKSSNIGKLLPTSGMAIFPHSPFYGCRGW
jgi:ABC-type Fe2+-enterobactin transport system substrate-binding protein